MRHGRFWLALPLVALLGWAVWSAAQPAKRPAAAPAEAADDELSAEEARERAVAERFRKVLEGNPRRGTALDRLYGYHVERGSLDGLVGGYRERTRKDAADGTAWMIVGLLESQRGRDAAAVAAFKEAEAHLPDNPLASYYLGQSLVLVGQPDAAAAFERAIARKPNRNDLLDIFQALGRVYQRSQRPEQALDVWNRLEKLFPDDARVQEQIATTLVEEGQFEQALPRLEKLARQTDDKYRQSALRLDAADLKVKMKRTAEGLADFEKLLGELDPDSWLYRDVRRRIEEVFLRNDDFAGLAKYYQGWLAKYPSDVEAVARLAKALSTQGRTPEARQALEKGIAAAPSNRALRQALIDLLVFEGDYAAALQQYEALDKADPNNPDTLREWGKLLLRDKARPEAERRAAAAAVWKRLLEKKPRDPVTASQVADLLRTAGITDEAVALYQKAIELAPNAAQYREYLGEYYHSLKRHDEALATWRPIAEGANRTPKNLVRLAEVLAGFGYRKEAVAAMTDAVRLEPDDFTMRMQLAELLFQGGQHDAALKQIEAAGPLTSNAEEVEQVLAAQIKVFQATEKLGEKIDELQKELDAGKDATADRWLRLARYYEANRQADKATEAIKAASRKDPRSVPVLTAAARIYESGGDLLAAADTNRRLAALDRRFRSEYLQAVVKLEQRLGRREQALQAGRDLLAASPGNPEVYKFFADLCFQLGDQDEGLEALRRSVRANPSDPQGLITLANALAERVRQGEAVELLWRAFDKTNDLEGKLGITERLTQLYLETNQLDRLLERLERERRETDKARELTMCLAQAYASAGDLGTARQQLERLLAENARDTGLPGQMVALCEQEGDLAAAVKYQRQLNAAAPNNYDNQLKLAQLLTRAGEPDEAADIWVKLVAGESEPHRNLTAIDQLLTAGKHDAALAILSRMLAQKPGNWELLYREGAALATRGKASDAAARFRALLALKLSDDELSEITKYQIEQAKKKPKPQGPTAQNLPYSPYPIAGQYGVTTQFDPVVTPPLTRRRQRLYEVRRAIGMDFQPYYFYGGGGFQPVYAPSDYGEARMACLGWLYELARGKGEADAFAKQLRDARNRAGADPRPLWDWYYFQTLRQENKDLVATAFTLSRGGDPAGLLAFLSTLGDRGNPNASRFRRVNNPDKDNTPPLPADQLAHALACYRKLKQTKPAWATSEVTQAVLTELKRARKADEEKAVYQDLVSGANTVEAVRAALGIAARRNDLDTALALYARLEKLQPPAGRASMLAMLPSRQAWMDLMQVMGRRADEKRYADVRRVLDAYLLSVRRQNQAAPRSASASRRSQMQSGGTGVFLYLRGSYGNSYTNLAYPSPNDYYDAGAISLLYNAYNLHKQADLTSDLVAHFRKQLDTARGAERLYLHLALGYLYWWAEEKDEALAELTQAVRAEPGDHALLLEVAAQREQNGENEAALALLDSVTPVDTQMMQRREEAALRLAERTGNLDRARQAADRLFGLRLDADKQVELAAQMHRLGMHDLAETVLGRAQRQAGNKTQTLVRLMTQYQSQNQSDLAVLIARQILRKAPSAPAGPFRGQSDVDMARTQAIGVLARSGQLKELIERAEAQLKASPKSLQVHQVLVSYYQAAGDRDKMKATLLKMAALKPDDGKLRFQVAQQLVQLGERDAALAQYAAAIKLEPSMFAYQYWEVQNLFAQANKFEELARLLDEIDLRKLSNNFWSVSEVVGGLLRNENTKQLGLKLFRKAWDAFPLYRGYILSNISDDAVWRLPEIYDYAKQALVPREDSETDPWDMASQLVSYNGDGRVEGVLTRMMMIARKQQRLPELRAEVAAALARRPDWTSGKALLAVLDIQNGDKERGRKEWREVFDHPGADIPPLARCILCQELEFYGGAEDLAVKVLEGGIDELIRDGQYEFSYHPGRRLVWWYKQLGRTEDARNLALRFASTEAVDPGYGGGYWQYRQIQNGLSIAQELQSGGDAAEAVRIYNRLLADREALAQASQWGGGMGFEQQIEQGLKTALKAVRPSTLPQTTRSLLTPRPGATGTGPVLDLVVYVDSPELAKMALNSLLGAALKSTAAAPEVRADALARLAKLVKRHPKDLSVQTAAALAAFADGKAGGTREAVERLARLLDATPLEALPPDGKANARQRADALQQVPVWLVARGCLGSESDALRAAGVKLGERAVAAARRQQNQLYAVAILREWGQIDLARGDRAKAEARWGELLELLLPRPQRTKAPARAVAALAQVPAAPAPASPAAKAPPKGAPVPTTEQFRQAYELATLAADHNLPELSLRAMREAVRGGPPVPPPNSRMGGGPLTMKMINGVQYYVSGGYDREVGVDQALVALVPKWRALHVLAAEVYQLVASAALPEARPAEVFLYSEGPSYGMIYAVSPSGVLTPATGVTDGSAADRGIGELLADLALEAGQADDLRRRAETRAGQPLGELPARLLLVTLALRQKDEARAAGLFKALGERLRKDSQQGTNDRVTAAVLPAFANPKYARLLLPVVEKAAENYAAANNPSQAMEVRFKLAGYYLARKDQAAARAQFKVVEGFGTKVGRFELDVHLPLARQYLKAGWAEDALRELGLHADHVTAAGADPRSRRDRDEPALAEMPQLVRVLLDLPAAERYRLLRAWSLPTAGRKSIRYYVGTTPKAVPPAQFVQLPPIPVNQVVHTMVLLAEAAKEAGKAGELTADADRLAAEKVENADLFRVLVYLALGRGRDVAPAVAAFAEAAHKRMTAPPEQTAGPRYFDFQNRQPAPVHPSEFVFAALCLADPAVSHYGEALLATIEQRARDTQNAEYVARARAARDRLAALRAGAPDGLAGGVPAHWLQAGSRSAWLCQDGYVVQAWNDGPSYLLMDTPLAGTFEFSVDAFQGLFAEGHVGYAGLVFEPNREGVGSSVWPVAQNENVFRKAEGIRDDQFNRLTVQVSPGTVRCLVNGRLFFEDTEASPASPWLALVSGAGRRPVFRNFSLTGEPKVPSEVRLTAGDHLEGWLPDVTGGTIPQRLLPKEQEAGRATDQWGNPMQPEAKKDQVYDWWAKDGELFGRKVQHATGPVPSRLAYFRPLRPGDTLRYEFLYEPDKTQVHPSLGRLAFLLEPGGVKLHWLTDAADDWTGLPADNAFDAPAGRRGGRLPLKAGAWNTVALTAAGDGVRIALNGDLVYEAPLGAEVERTFGLFHYRDLTAARVRNVVLTGAWPKALASREAAFITKPVSPAVASARHRVVGEKYYATEAGEVLARARTLAPAERYKLLAAWVLPTASRPVLQLAGEVKPLDVLGVVDQKHQPEGRRVLLGGRFEAPCLELVAAAREAGMLNDLATRLDNTEAPAADVLLRRSRTALLAVVRAAQGDDAGAAEALKELLPLARQLPPGADALERWPDLIAVTGTLDRPALRGPATDLAEAMNRNLDQSMILNQPFDQRDWWLRAARAVRARAQLLARPAGSDGGFAHWASVPGVSAVSRGQGSGVPHWTYRDGTVTHLPGHDEDYLLLRTPLRGNFEVTCRLRIQGWTEAQVRYGPYQFDLNFDRKQYRLHTNVLNAGQPVTILPPLPASKGNAYRFRLAVKDGWLRTFVDDREVVAERIGANPDPWLMLHASHLNTGVLEDVRIHGSPTVPEAIDLLAGEDLGMWRPYHLGMPWTKRGEEAYQPGQKPEPPDDGRPPPPRSFPEAALYYQRPLLEDGAVEYDFFYQPDKAHVHPMLDRLVFLLEPDGVRLHWLTDGPFDRSGVPFDNATDEPACRRGPAKLPLRPGVWNRVRLAVAGDTVQLALNGTPVYERPIEPTNQRLFGLFHYTDRTEARVRSVTYTGDWPRRLPASDKLFEPAK